MQQRILSSQEIIFAKKKIARDDQLSLVALDSPVLLSPSIVSFFFLITD